MAQMEQILAGNSVYQQCMKPQFQAAVRNASLMFLFLLPTEQQKNPKKKKSLVTFSFWSFPWQRSMLATCSWGAAGA